MASRNPDDPPDRGRGTAGALSATVREMRVSATVCIDRPSTQVWALLADLERIADWAPGIRSATCPVGLESGTGAVRHCRLTGGIELVETFTAPGGEVLTVVFWQLWEGGRLAPMAGTTVWISATSRASTSAKCPVSMSTAA